MNTRSVSNATRESEGLFRFLMKELKPRGRLLTPFNVISIPVILLGAVLLAIRFTKGLGSITNLSQDVPWGSGSDLTSSPASLSRAGLTSSPSWSMSCG